MPRRSSTRAATATIANICFSCGTTWRDGQIERCARCGEPLEVEGELSVCNGCLASLADRE